MPTKTKKHAEHKRHGHHHSHNKKYKQVYWPFMPLLVSVVTFGLSAFSFFQIPAASFNVLAYATEMSHTSLLDSTNDQRINNGSNALSFSTQLSTAAQAKANDMATRNYWSHNTPDGQEPWIFIDQVGYRYIKAGENLAYGFSTSSATVAGWMNSASHRANLLDNNFTEVGFGYANSAEYNNSGNQTIVVAMYARPEVLGASNASPTQSTPASSRPVAVNTPVESAQEVPVKETAPAASTDSAIVEESKPITKVEIITRSQAAWIPLAIGLISGSAVTALFISHGLRLRKLFWKAEHYFVSHPLFDISLIGIIVFCLELSRTAGFVL